MVCLIFHTAILINRKNWRISQHFFKKKLTYIMLGPPLPLFVFVCFSMTLESDEWLNEWLCAVTCVCCNQTFTVALLWDAIMTLYFDIGPMWTSIPLTLNLNHFYQISSKNDICSFQGISPNCFHTRVSCHCWVPVYFVNYIVCKRWVYIYQLHAKCVWAEIFHDFSHFTSCLDLLSWQNSPTVI